MNQDQQIISRYLGQPGRLPRDLRAQVEHAWGGLPVQLYALADLDHRLQLAESWLLLGERHLALAQARAIPSAREGSSAAPDAQRGWDVRSVERARITAVQEAPGLSANALLVVGQPDEAPLLAVRYTQRQRGAVENVRFVLEEALEGRVVDASDADADRMYEDAIARPVRDAQALVGNRRSAVLRRLLGYLLRYKAQLGIGLAAATVVTALSLVPAWLTGYLIDDVLGGVRAGTMTAARAQRVAWMVVGTMAMVHLVRQATGLVRLRLLSILGEYVARDLRAELYTHIQRLSLAFFSRKKTGSLITRVTSDTDRLWDFLAFGVVDVSLSLVMLVGLGAVLLALDWRLGLVMTLPVPVFCWLIYRHGEKLNARFIRNWRKWSRMTDVLGDTIPGVRVVKAFNQEPREVERFVTRNDDVTEESNDIHRMWTTFWPILVGGVRMTTVLVWALAVPRLLGQGPALSPGVFVSFVLYMSMFLDPIEQIGQMVRTLNRATSSAHRVFEVLDSEPEVREPREPVRLAPVKGRVTFDGVTFAYDGVRQVLKGVSFEVQPGEMIGLVGPSGGGKSTVINLVARFYDVTGGSVRIDGVDVRQLDTGHYRRQLGMVLQDPYLFHGTVLENIAYGHPNASLDEIVAAARAANAHDFVCGLGQGYDTIVGERGHTLSGGERQRISIARAILHDPRILILDEATSAVDTETEREIQEALERLIHGRTVIAIAHRLSTLRKASRLFVIEQGRLVESGTHAELLAVGDGVYRKLYELQLQLA